MVDKARQNLLTKTLKSEAFKPSYSFQNTARTIFQCLVMEEKMSKHLCWGGGFRAGATSWFTPARRSHVPKRNCPGHPPVRLGEEVAF